MDRADLVGGVGLAVLGVLMIFVIIPLSTEEGSYFGLSPTFFPTLITVFATACALALAVQALYRIRKQASARPVPISGWNLLMFLIATGLVLGGVVLIDWVGILIGGPVLIAAFMLFLGERGPLRILLTATLPVGFFYLLALYVLGMPVP